MTDTIATPLAFAGPSRSITLHAPAPVAVAIARIAPLWPGAAPAAVADVSVAMAEGSFTLAIAAYAAPAMAFPHALAAANGAVGALIGCHVVQDAGLLALHAASFRGRDGLVVLLGDHLAGKSTLALALAALDLPLAGDDRLVVRGETTGVALGLVPKLRLPLPPSAPPAFRAFVGAHRGATEGDMQYVAAPTLLPWGETAPLAALIVLRRAGDSAPALSSIAPAATLVGATFAPHLDPTEKLARIKRLAALPAMALDYGDSFAAADFLAARFS
jgi:hypothetical protein